MDEHTEIRDLLALAAAGALEPGEQQRVEAHLRDCAACARDLAGLRALAAELRIVPAPQPSLGLAARTRARVAAEFTARAERRRYHLLLGLLISFGWLLTLLTVLVFRYFGEDLARFFRLSFSELEIGLIAYTLLAALATAAFAGLAGPRHQAQRRTS
jgi:anti-sigma factor RsiW